MEVAENSGKQLEYHQVQPQGGKTGEILQTKELCSQTSKKQERDRELNGGGEA